MSAGLARALPPSEFLGVLPEPCQPEYCPPDNPFSDPPSRLRLVRLSHELSSPACVTDRIFIHYEYPEGTGSPALDSYLKNQVTRKFDSAKAKALKMSCNDFFDGCGGFCLPVSFELSFFFQRSSERLLSILQVERFTGNTRRGRHLNSTVSYHFTNYDLSTGSELKLTDVYADPKKSLPLLWGKAEEILKTMGDACPLDKYLIGGKKAGGKLGKNDFLLSRRGMSILLTNAKAGAGCVSLVLDIPVEVLLETGINPELFGETDAP
jgi:hypothetical protein